MWISLLKMLGKGPPPNGESFTELSCNATPGGFHTFTPKEQVGAVNGIFYFLRYIAGMN